MADDAVVIPVPGTAELHLLTRSGHVEVHAEERDDVVIELGAPSEHRIESDATGRIKLPSARGGTATLVLRTPTGSDVVVGTISGNVKLQGQLGAVRVTTVSGSIEVDRAEALDARSVAGNIDVDRCSGQCRLQTKSGRAVCNSAASAQVSTISGLIKLGETAGSVSAQSASGKIEVDMRSAGDVKVRTMSGPVRVAVPRGVRPSTSLRSLSGRPRSECEEGNDCEIRVQSLSGRIEVVPS